MAGLNPTNSLVPRILDFLSFVWAPSDILVYQNFNLGGVCCCASEAQVLKIVLGQTLESFQNSTKRVAELRL